MKIKLPRDDRGRFRGYYKIDETQPYFRHWLFGRFRRGVLRRIKAMIENG